MGCLKGTKRAGYHNFTQTKCGIKEKIPKVCVDNKHFTKQQVKVLKRAGEKYPNKTSPYHGTSKRKKPPKWVMERVGK